MAINSISPNTAVPNLTSSALSPTDTETKNIQNQITSMNQSLNRLSSDSEMSAEEKAKQRQEIQKQIAELNRKLRMLRMKQKEEAEAAEKELEQKNDFIEDQKKELAPDSSKKESSVETLKEQQEKINIPPQNIQKLLEAGTLLQKERIQQNVDREKESTINILESEIKLDKIQGSDTSGKKEKLSSMIKQKPFEIKIEEPQKLSQDKFSGKIVIKESEM